MFSVPLAERATSTGCSNSLSTLPIQRTEGDTRCWLLYGLPKMERPLYLPDAALQKVLLPGGCSTLSPTAHWRVPPLQAAAWGDGLGCSSSLCGHRNGWRGSPGDAKKQSRGSTLRLLKKI